MTGAADIGTLTETGQPLVSSTFGDLRVDIGADKGATHVEFAASAVTELQALGLTSDAVALDYELRDNGFGGQEIVAFKPGASSSEPVFIIGVYKPASFAATLFQNVDHATGSDNLALKLGARIFDADGDYADTSFIINIKDDAPTIIQQPADYNLLTNGDFSQGGLSTTGYGHDFTGPMGWTVKGTTPGHESVKLEAPGNGYLGMSTSTGGSMVDLAASPGNVEISQSLSGLDRSKTYSISFEVGSPNPASAGLEVYWNGVKIGTGLVITNKMTLVTLTGLAPDDLGNGTLSFKEVGSPDNTGTYLANIALTLAGAVDLPVLTGQMGDDAADTFDLKDGAQFQFGADGAGSVTFDSGAAILAGPSGISLGKPTISYDQATGKLTITPVADTNKLAQSEMATLTIPFSVQDQDGDIRTGLYQVVITGANDAPEIYAEKSTDASATLIETDAGLVSNGTLTVLDIDSTSKVRAEVTLTTASNAGYSVVGAETFFSLTKTTLTDADEGHHNLGWKFDPGKQAFDFLPKGAELVLTYTIKVTDELGASDSQEVTITITGTNDAAVISGKSSGAVTEDSAITTASGQLFAADVDNPANTFQAQSNVGSTYGKFSIGTDGKWVYTLDNANPAVHDLNTGKQLTDTFTIKSVDGTPQIVTVTINGTTDNTAPVITAPGQIGYFTNTFASPGGWENVTYINRLVIADKEQVNGPITLRLSLKDGTLEGSSADGVSVSGNGTRVLTLTGQIADINAFIATNGVEFDPDLGWPFAGLDDRLTVTVDDGHGGVATSVVAIKHSSDLRHDWSGWNLNDVTVSYEDNKNDTVVTSWSHGPSGWVLYDGGERYEWKWEGWSLKREDVSNDQITLVTTADQLSEILVSTAHRNELDNFLSSPEDDLDLRGAAWNAVVTGFEKAQLAIVTGPNSHVVYAPASGGLADLASAGDNKDNLLIAKLGGSVLDSGKGHDILVGRDGADTLKGGEGNDLLLGGAGNDRLHGGAGNDILVGGAGKDSFVFAEDGKNNSDTIADFAIGEDEIDLSALLDGSSLTQATVGDHLRLNHTGDDAVLQIRTNGNTNGNSWSDVAVLSGHGTPGTTIDIKIDDHDFTIKVI